MSRLKSPIKSMQKNGRFNLFFVEMIIVLLFFSIAAAIILRSFVIADRLAGESRRTESMAFCAQSAAEIFSRTASLSETAETLFGTAGTEGISEITVPVTSECKYSPTSAEMYMMMRETEEKCGEGSIRVLNIFFRDGSGEILYEMRSGAYSSERAVSGIE